MNKVEALKAMLDGKVFALGQDLLRCNAATAAFEYTRTGSRTWLSANINAFEPDGYELYVEPARDATRAEAWAALDQGKVVRLVHDRAGAALVRLNADDGLQFRDDHKHPYHHKHPAPTYREWTRVDALWDSYCNVYTGTKFYILEGEP